MSTTHERRLGGEDLDEEGAPYSAGVVDSGVDRHNGADEAHSSASEAAAASNTTIVVAEVEEEDAVLVGGMTSLSATVMRLSRLSLTGLFWKRSTLLALPS